MTEEMRLSKRRSGGSHPRYDCFFATVAETGLAATVEAAGTVDAGGYVNKFGDGTALRHHSRKWTSDSVQVTLKVGVSVRAGEMKR